jgi:tetratricopeptide (TPR) repeat protein
LNLGKMGNVTTRLEDYGRARSLLEESLGELRDLGDRASESTILGDLGDLEIIEGRIDAAHALFAQSLTLRRDLEDRWGISDSLRKLGTIACHEAKWAHAVLLFAAAEALREAIGVPVPPSDVADYEARCAAARDALGDAAFTAGWEEGRTISTEAAITAALRP